MPRSAHHPFSRLSDAARRQAFTLLLLLVLVLSTFLMVLGEPLRTPVAPQGIVSFELAGSGETAAEILESWSPAVRQLAMLNLGLDYLYLLAYPAVLSLACVAVAGRLRARSAGATRLGIALAWAVLVAAALDAIENAALIRMLIRGPSDAMARIAWLAAVPKFVLVLAALGYATAGWVWSRVPRRSAEAVE